MNKTFQEKINLVDEIIDEAEDLKTKAITSRDEVQKQFDLLEDELTEDDMHARWALEGKLDALTNKITTCVRNIRDYERRKKDLTSYHNRYLSNIRPDICNAQNSPQIYVFHFNKKLALLTEIFSFCISETDREEWTKNLPKVIDLTLSESKLSLKDLVRKKIENFRVFVKPQFESEENFAKFQKFSKFHELLADDTNKSSANVESFFNSRIESLVEQPDDLNTLISSFSLLRDCIPFLVAQPKKEQMIDSVLQPFPTLRFNTKLLQGERLSMSIINADTQAIVRNAIDEKKRTFHLTADWICFANTYLTNSLNTNDTYQLHILIGPYSIVTGTFKMVA